MVGLFFASIFCSAITPRAASSEAVPIPCSRMRYRGTPDRVSGRSPPRWRWSSSGSPSWCWRSSCGSTTCARNCRESASAVESRATDIPRLALILVILYAPFRIMGILSFAERTTAVFPPSDFSFISYQKLFNPNDFSLYRIPGEPLVNYLRPIGLSVTLRC